MNSLVREYNKNLRLPRLMKEIYALAENISNKELNRLSSLGDREYEMMISNKHPLSALATLLRKKSKLRRLIGK